MNIKQLFRVILCAVGWHEFTWKLRRNGVINLSSNPPDDAKCKHCGIRFGKDP